MVDQQRVREIADRVMAAIIEDTEAGVIPWTVTGWGHLDDHTDANMYLDHAGQVLDLQSEDSMAECAAIIDAVDRRIAAGEVTGGQWFTVHWSRAVVHQAVLPLRALRPGLDRARLLPLNASTEHLPLVESDATVQPGGERIVLAAMPAAAPEYVEPADRYSGRSILDDPRVQLRALLRQLRALDAEAGRLGAEGGCDGFEHPQAAAEETANETARKVLRVALALLGMDERPEVRCRCVDDCGHQQVIPYADIKAIAAGGHLCDEECGDPTHPRDGRVMPG